ncbi:hypothetical protein BDF14DRAFT_1717801, partial [Spinellus fusiger]
DVMICSQFFVNYYILCQNNQLIDNKIYAQNSWYSVTQMVLNKTVTNRSSTTHVLSVVWEKIVTAYTNLVVECFESKVKNDLFYSVKILFEEVKHLYTYL